MPQNALILKCCEATGLRVSDVLKFENPFKQRGTIVETKTGKRKYYYIPKNLYYQIREQSGIYYAFEHAKDPHRHKTRQAVWADIKRAQKAFRLPENIGTHSMRKRYAVAQYSKSGDLQKVKKLLNHDNIYTTMLYAMADELTKASLKAKQASKRQRKKQRG